MVQEKADMVIVLMNDKGYGVIKNIQDAQYGGRQLLRRPAHARLRLLCKSLRCRTPACSDLAICRRRWTRRWRRRPVPAGDRHALHRRFKTTFAGPPTNTVTQIPRARHGQVCAASP
jgi:acetolactate synthase-1/2/3 large subunit